MCTTFPNLIGLVNEILSTEAVTTGELQCFAADNAAAISIQYINRPPIKLPNVLVSLGSTISVIMIRLSAAFLNSINIFFCFKDKPGNCLGMRFFIWRLMVNSSTSVYKYFDGYIF